MKAFLLAIVLALPLLALQPAFALAVPDPQLATESRDATLVTSPDQTATKDSSAFKVFLDTLLGKDIDQVPEKETEE